MAKEPDSEEIYVLMSTDMITKESVLKIGHTTLQGAAMEMVSYTPAEQLGMNVACITLIRDPD